MADSLTAPALAAVSKAKKAGKPKKSADHPPYSTMVVDAIRGLADRKGSSRQAILKHVLANNKVDAAKAAVLVRKSLTRLVASNQIVAAAAAGRKGAGSFRLSPELKKAKAKKVAAKISKKAPKKAGAAKKAKKPAAKKMGKKAAKKPGVKKAAAKKPAKKAVKKTGAKK